MTYQFTHLSDTEKQGMCGNRPEKHREFGSEVRNAIIKGYYASKKEGKSLPWNLNTLIFLCQSVWRIEPLALVDGKGNRHVILLDLNKRSV